MLCVLYAKGWMWGCGRILHCRGRGEESARVMSCQCNTWSMTDSGSTAVQCLIGCLQCPIREFPRIPHLYPFHLLIFIKGLCYFKLEFYSQAQSYQNKVLSLGYMFLYYRDPAGTLCFPLPCPFVSRIAPSYTNNA